MKKIFFLFLYMLIVIPLFSIQFEDLIVKKSDEMESSLYRLRLYPHMVYKKAELYSFLGDSSQKIINEYRDFNSSTFLELDFENLTLLFIKRNEFWELFKIRVSSDQYSLLNGISVGMDYNTVKNIIGDSYFQKVIQPGEILHSYFWKDQLLKNKDFEIEFSILYSQFGPTMVIESICIELVAPSI
ncbi:MAG: hypothetical protein PQJ50_10210 [Spirochaetales bacterium]|nr:hypothetical protein [Spirochaetales bacterium]